MNKNPVTVVVVLIVAGTSFFGGIKFKEYQLNKQRNNFSGQFGGFQRGSNTGNVQNRNVTRGLEGRPVAGEIISMDDRSITVKAADGSTKIVILTDKTTYSKTSDTSRGDIKVGDQVGVFGTPGADGSVTAQSIQLN
jgi:hypothetical protein